ncbi:MAG: FkbM family methyltransferase [Bacteroidetes bacterium]|nr:FkbM family methyltransferase [Bacteroidota bacterium]
MKKSLQKAIAVFPFQQQLQLLFFFFWRKFGINTGGEATKLAAECEQYVQLIENGVSIKRENKNILQLHYSINQRSCLFFIRRKGSDIKVFETVILQEEYKSSKDQLAFANNHQPQIIDAGGNIGFTTIYLHAFFPAASFIVIEPDVDNYELLKKNIVANEIEKATLLQNALWVNEDELEIDDSFRDGQEWSLTVCSANSSAEKGKQKNVKGVTLSALQKHTNFHEIDLLKIDVEGTERFLFREHTFVNTLLDFVKNLAIEIHDEYEIRQVIYNTMQKEGFEKKEDGDVTLFFKK